jgi:hypothetical protein
MAMEIMPFHERLAELWFIHTQQHKLNRAEQKELEMCLEANLNHVWKRMKLKQLSLVAYEAGDMDWMHEICAKLDQLDDTKKSGSQGTNTDQ